MAATDAFEVALAALGRKERTIAEVEALMGRRGFDASEVRSALERLIEDGALDDERFARRYAEDKRELAGWGPERIREALVARGVASADVEAVLAADSHADQLDRARDVLVQRGRPLENNAERQRALEHLARRGYDYEIAYEAVRQVSAPRAA